MPTAFELVERLTRDDPPREQIPQLLSEFSYQFGWRPSAIGDSRIAGYLGNAHLMVEHGLDNAAVLTFLPRGRPSTHLQIDEWNSLVGISYNNLVDWHVLIERDRVSYVYNRAPARQPAAIEIGPRDYSALSRDRFEEVLGTAPNPNMPALDEALVRTILHWKRLIASELGQAVSNRNFSALFNALLLVRAVEDYSRTGSVGMSRTLVDTASDDPGAGIAQIIERSVRRLTQRRPPRELWERQLLDPFDRLARADVMALFADFYRHQGIPYRYDFSVISKHALSRVYEKYVSLLRYEDSAQLAFYPPVPTEYVDKASGTFYTPEFIARFFARYLQENLPPAVFKKVRVADLACGSGIFLRSVLEAQMLSFPAIRDPLTLPEAIDALLGVDIDENACAASRLSLAVLYLVASGTFPRSIPIHNDDAISYFESHTELIGALDAFVVNPPFVRVESQPPNLRAKVARFMEGIATGRLDSYLPFLKIGIESLRPRRFGLFVLPQAFLTASSAQGVRQWVRENAWIRCVADLSAVRVFEDLGSYVILLVIERREEGAEEPSATVVRCQNYPGLALQDYLDGKRLETPHYAVFDVPQSAFDDGLWAPATPKEAAVQKRMAAFPSLSRFVDVAQGVITGMDSAFIVRTADVPRGERAAYRPYMPDSAVTQYWLPEETGYRIFYPFDGDMKLKRSEGTVAELDSGSDQ